MTNREAERVDRRAVGMVGLGLLGSALAERFLSSGRPVVGFDLNPYRRRELAARGGADLFACFAREWFYLGPWGSGSRMKLVVNLVLGLNRAVLAEGLAFARACGLDPA